MKKSLRLFMIIGAAVMLVFFFVPMPRGCHGDAMGTVLSVPE